MTNLRIGHFLSVPSWVGALVLLSGTAAGEGSDKAAKPSQSPAASGEQRGSEQRGDVKRMGGEDKVTSLSSAGRDAVKQIQRELAARNLYHGKIDGIAGMQTKEALENFQAQQGTPATGELDDRTADALGLKGERQAVSGTDVRAPAGSAAAQPTSSMDDTSSVELSSLSENDAKKIQQRLQELGFYRGEIDGVLGQQTRAALRQYFQQQAQLVAQGKLGESAADALGISIERQPTSGTEASPTSSKPMSQPAK
jgi:peptidoglycan hydrolase-like protein with peptidoglycan-binding domain